MASGRRESATLILKNSLLTTHHSKPSYIEIFSYFCAKYTSNMMKTLRKAYIFLLIATIFTACTEHGDFERRLAVADSLMTHEQPDSAYRMLCGMDAEAEEVSEPLRMRHLLLRSNAQNKAYVDFTSDSIGCLLVDYYTAHGTPNERMLAHYIKGCAYRDMGDQPASLRCYNDAVAAADTSAADCNFYQLSIIHEQIAKIFNDRAMPDNALQAYEYAERYARKVQDSIGIFTIWGNKSNALIVKGEIKEALRIKEAAAEGFRKLGNSKKAARVLGLCIKWYALQGEFDKAKVAMDEYEKRSGYFQENGDIEPGREDYYHIKGTYYYEKGEMDSAQYFFRKLRENTKSRNGQYLSSCGLTQLYHWMGKHDSVAKYALQALVHSDTLYNIGAAENLQNAQAMYNYDRHQEKALRKEMEAKEARIRFYQLTLGVVLLAILLFLILYRKAKRNKQAIEGLNCLIAGLNDVISKNAADLQLKEKLEQSVNILEEKLETYRKEKEIHSQTHNLNTLQQQPVVKHFTELANGRVAYPTYKDWHTLYPLVEEFYPQLAVLRKDISDAEYQICVLTKLGFRLSDIGHLTHLDNNNLCVMRTRLLTKLFHTKGGTSMFDKRIKEL